jgi:hypothetical protein
LPDRRPAGLATRINTTPFTLAQLGATKGITAPKPPKPKAIQIKKDPALQVQARPMPAAPFHDAITALGRMGIDLMPPRDDEIQKVIEKDEQRPARRVARTPSGGVSLASRAPRST